MADEPPRYVKPGAAEKALGVERRTLQKWAEEGLIKSLRPGGKGQRLYDIQDVHLQPLRYCHRPRCRRSQKQLLQRVRSRSWDGVGRGLMKNDRGYGSTSACKVREFDGIISQLFSKWVVLLGFVVF